MPASLPALASLVEEDRLAFERDGFLIIKSILDAALIERLRSAFPRIFKGDFDTGIYPDEWHWREGVSLPNVTRHMGNAWKSDLTIASLVLSADIGRAAAFLAGWRGAKLGQDTIWWKPAGTKAGTFHQDTSFLSFLSPRNTITCWFTLDDTYRKAGTLEYVRGSNKWPLSEIPGDFLNPDDYQAPMRLAADAAGIEEPEIVPIEVPAGSCVIHAGETWHGSERNQSENIIRRAIGIHLISEDAVFSDEAGGYIYRRYQRTGSNELDESFFPILFSRNGERTDWIDRYCTTGRR